MVPAYPYGTVLPPARDRCRSAPPTLERGRDGSMAAVSAVSGPIPRGLRLVFVALTVIATALIVLGAVQEVWFLVVIGAFFALSNLAVLWVTRTSRA